MCKLLGLSEKHFEAMGITSLDGVSASPLICLERLDRDDSGEQYPSRSGVRQGIGFRKC